MRKIAWAVLIGVVLISLALFSQRRMLIVRVAWLLQPELELAEPLDEGRAVEWYDDYYTVERIDPDTIAIGEPRYHQQNYNYLILGRSRAILFDSGPGLRSIRPVVESLTSLPVTAVPSHFHFDHVGSHESFTSVAVVDLPYLRERAPDGRLEPTTEEHLGFLEGISPPLLRVTEWWEPGSAIDLGARRLQVIHAPGHTYESIVLYDPDREQLFTGDYIYQGVMFAFLPGSGLGDYLRTAEGLIDLVPDTAILLTAHRATPPGAPVMEYRDLADLREALRTIRDGVRSGSGFFPRVFPVNDRMSLYSDLPWTERWD